MAKNQPDCDVAIVGGGHNGLTCAAYLAKAGYSVKVFERRGIVGGAAVTEEFHPGFRNSVCSYTVSLLNPKVIEDLDLHRHGLEIVHRKVPNFLPLSATDMYAVHKDPARNKAEIARFSEKDAAAMDDYNALIERLAEVLRKLVLETPPNVGGGLSDLGRAVKAVKYFNKLDLPELRDLSDIMVMSAADFLDRWFESDTVKALLAYDGIVGTMASPYHPGTAYVLLHHCFGEVNGVKGAWGHAIGGMGSISNAIAAAAREAGATIETDAAIKEVLIENDRASGLVLEDGRTVRARVVAANVNPKLLFGQLLGEDTVDVDFRQRMKNYKCASGSFRMNIALTEIPKFSCVPDGEHEQYMSGGVFIAPTMDYMDRSYAEARSRGWAKRSCVELVVPTTLDATLAPEGQHVASLFCQHFNPDLPGGQNWDDVKDEVVNDIIDTVTELAPNFRPSILGLQALSPLDLEREFGLIGGDIFHGTLDLNQLYAMRPTMGHADYRMPVKGLYLCGSGAHPGGGVTGVPGHNAAREIISDLKSWFRP